MSGVLIHRPRVVQRFTEPQGATTIFSDGFESGNLNKWNSLQWSTSGVVRDTAGTAYSGTGEYSCQVQTVGTHTNAVRFELRDGDEPFLGTERTEIGEPFTTTPGDVDIVPGDERWIGWDWRFDSTYPVPDPASSWCVVWQWHPNDGTASPAICLDIDTDDVIYLAYNQPDANYKRTAVQSVTRNVWQRWVLHVLFNEDPAIGYVDIWVDGTKVIDHELRATMIPSDTGSYFKIGNYRDPVNSATAIVNIDNILITAP
jgi:hypothetical protein